MARAKAIAEPQVAKPSANCAPEMSFDPVCTFCRGLLSAAAA